MSIQKTYFIFLFFITSSWLHLALAQKLNKDKLLNSMNADSTALFVINGLPFDDDITAGNIQQKLDCIDPKKVVAIEVLKTESSTLLRKDVVVINYAVELPFEQIQSKLNEIIPKFEDTYYGFSSHIYTDAKDPVLYINGNRIHHTETKKAINDLAPDQIAYIFNTPVEQSMELHGQNAKNGIVFIWTKGKL